MQFGAGFQSLEEHIDTEDENQHGEDNGDGQMVSRKVGAADVEIVVRGYEALADHCAHTDKDTPRRESSMRKMGGLHGILRVRRGGRCHRRRVSVSCLGVLFQSRKLKIKILFPTY